MSTIPSWKPDRQGFVCHWLVSGPLTGALEADDDLPGDQFAREDRLRAAFAGRPAPREAPGRIRADAQAAWGSPGASSEGGTTPS